MKASVILYRALPSPASPNFSIWAFDAMPQPNFPNPLPKSALSVKIRSVASISQILQTARMPGRSLTINRLETHRRNRRGVSINRTHRGSTDLVHRRYWLNSTLGFSGPVAAALAAHHRLRRTRGKGSKLRGTAVAIRARNPRTDFKSAHESLLLVRIGVS
jgi:hypothetical protein